MPVPTEAVSELGGELSVTVGGFLKRSPLQFSSDASSPQPSRAYLSFRHTSQLPSGGTPELERTSRLVGLLLLLAAPAIAEQRSAPEPALAYRVVNVASADVLQVRSQPEASAPIVGHLAANATGIIVTGVKQSVGQASW